MSICALTEGANSMMIRNERVRRAVITRAQCTGQALEGEYCIHGDRPLVVVCSAAEDAVLGVVVANFGTDQKVLAVFVVGHGLDADARGELIFIAAKAASPLR